MNECRATPGEGESSTRPRSTRGSPTPLADRPGDWKAIGPYLSERAWGTVREDYSADGKAWEYFPHDHARSRAYRWSEDGLAGVCDLEQRLCLALAFWNGRDPYPEGAHLRLDRPRGQPRRGRQGVLVVPRRDADRLLAALALPLPAGGVPLRAAARGERAPRPGGPGVRARRHRRLRRRPLLADHRRLREGVATRPLPADPRPQRRARGGRAPRAADVVDAEHLVLGGRAAEGRSIRAASGRAGRGERQRRGERPRAVAARRRAPTPRGRRRRCSSARTRRTSRASSGSPRGHRTPRTASTTTWSRGAATVNPARPGRRSPPGIASAFAPGETVELRLRLAPDDAAGAPDLGAGVRADARRTASARPTRTTRSCGPPARPTTRRP